MAIVIILCLLVLVGGLFILVYRGIKKNEQLASKDFSYLRWIIGMLSIAIFLGGLGIVANLIYNSLGFLGVTKDGQNLWHLQSGNIMSSLTFENSNTPVGLVIDTLHWSAILGVFVCLRIFMKNILTEAIFVLQNAQLARWLTYCLIIAALVSQEGTGLVTISSDEGNYDFLNLNYLLGAAVTWTMSIILEKAIAIAEENEFTI
ncbi:MULTISPECIES: DUF2975 domain-containing protein [Streptococcus]|uniref:DUF2975 domain-containing protein n=1 Tax=Streptococcus caledonicus TaxID=2614158 RepID=A0ABW0UDM7_9STRE|nr:DUF2975 domain-containing protein [Streptococcus sp. S784/96/1]